jgi:flagellar biogenesis protein FliO
MIAFLEKNLIHFYLGSMLIMFGGCFWGVRRLSRRARIARGNRG